MRGCLLTIALVGACDASGVIQIRDDDVVDSDPATPSDTDTVPPGQDTEVVGDDTADTGAGDSADTGAGPSPLDAARLAWDGRVVHDFTGYVGAYGCKATLVEQGEELAPVDVTAALRSGCTTCTRFFEVRVHATGGSCLESWGDTEWRALEPRPTGAVKVVEIYTGGGGGPVPRDPYPNAQLSGSTMSWKTSRSAFPIYQTEKIRGTVTLTPI